MKFLITFSFILIASTVSFSQSDSLKHNEEIWGGMLQQYPKYAGEGDYRSFILMNLSNDVLDYCHEKKIKGRVIVNFVVTSKGEVRDVKIVKKLNPIIDTEIMRVIKLTKWSPGHNDSGPVSSMLSIPINF